MPEVTNKITIIERVARKMKCDFCSAKYDDIVYLVHWEDDLHICESCIIAAMRQLLYVGKKYGNLNEAIPNEIRELLISELKE